jgi:hypothetical protein
MEFRKFHISFSTTATIRADLVTKLQRFPSGRVNVVYYFSLTHMAFFSGS